MKVELQRPSKSDLRQAAISNRRGEHLFITHCLPFFYRPETGRHRLAYVHRVRKGSIYLRDGQYSHTAFHFWCGGSGFLRQENPRRSRRGHPGGFLYSVPPEHTVSCATCEGRVIGAGLTESRVLAGRVLVFTPRL